MKLASYHDGSRDGHLVVVSHDGATAHYASGIASRLQQVFDDWNFVSPQLEDLSTALNQGRARHAFAFDAALCLAPLPRACQRVQTLARAHPADPADPDAPADPADPSATAPQLLQRSGDRLHGAARPLRTPDAAQAVLCAPGFAVLTGDVSAGASADSAGEAVRLLVLMAEVDPAGAAAARFAPLAVTPDELGPGGWRGGRVRLRVRLQANDDRRIELDDGAARWPAGELLARLARHGAVGAGSIVGLGVLGEARRLGLGERLRIDVASADGHSVFGALELAL